MPGPGIWGAGSIPLVRWSRCPSLGKGGGGPEPFKAGGGSAPLGVFGRIGMAVTGFVDRAWGGIRETWNYIADEGARLVGW